MGQGSKTNKISETVDRSIQARARHAPRQQLARLQEQAAAAEAEAAAIAERARTQTEPGAVLDLRDDAVGAPCSTFPAPGVQPSAARAQTTSATAEAAMRLATKDAFTKAIADGLPKEEARDVARKAGKSAFRAAMKSEAASESVTPLTQATPALPPSPPALLPSPPRTDLKAAEATSTPAATASGLGWASPFARPRELSAEELAAQAQALADEKADRARRMATNLANAKKKTSSRSNRL